MFGMGPRRSFPLRPGRWAGHHTMAALAGRGLAASAAKAMVAVTVSGVVRATSGPDEIEFKLPRVSDLPGCAARPESHRKVSLGSIASNHGRFCRCAKILCEAAI
jgi:hypothetical protein